MRTVDVRQTCIIGFLTFHAPAIIALALVIYIAAWALMIGVTEIVVAIRLRREIRGEWFLILMGIVSVILAIILLWNPLPGALALVWVIGSYAIVFGSLGNHLRLPLAQPVCLSDRVVIDVFQIAR